MDYGDLMVKENHPLSNMPITKVLPFLKPANWVRCFRKKDKKLQIEMALLEKQKSREFRYLND